MKKKRYLILLFISLLGIILIVMILGQITGDSITGDTITGDATQDIGINISVVSVNPPTLTINKPENDSYFENDSIVLFLSSLDVDEMWYNLDNGANTTFTAQELSDRTTTFNTSQGGHRIYVYANNSIGVTPRNVSFNVDTNLFNYSYVDYEGNRSGASTIFKNLSYTEIQNISNFTLEHTDYGKIFFNEIVNLTDINGNSIDFNISTNISLNRIEINSTLNLNLNKSANLSLYNLSFSNPRILRDGEICSSSVCTKQSYTGGALKTLKFNVTGFTIYSAEETPSGVVSKPFDTGSGSGVGGGVFQSIFSLDKEKIKISLKQGEQGKQEITIKNIGNQKLKINLENEFGDFLVIGETIFDLDIGESRTVILFFNVGKDIIPDLYIGKVLVKSEKTKKEIFIAMEVEGEQSFFEVKSEIPEDFLKVRPGKEIKADINCRDLKNRGKIEVNIDYLIKDDDGNNIISEQETLTVDTQASFTKTFKLPKGIKTGDYIFYVKLTYKGEVSSSSSWFFVTLIEEELPFIEKERISLIILVTIFLVIIILLLILRKLDKKELHKRKKRKIIEKK